MPNYYSKEVVSHFLRPKHFGKLKNADGVGDTQNLRCGDLMKIYIKAGKKDGKEIIKEIKFETLGCGHALASSDMICDLAKGKTLEQALKIDFKDIAKNLGNMPPQKLHCCQLAQTALKGAIEDYRKKQADKDNK